MKMTIEDLRKAQEHLNNAYLPYREVSINGEKLELKKIPMSTRNGKVLRYMILAEQ